MPDHFTAVEPYVRTASTRSKASQRRHKLSRLHIPGELRSCETVGAILALILLTRLRLMGELSPFGLTFWAVTSRGETRRMWLYGIIMIATASLGKDWLYSGGLLAGSITFILLRYRLHRIHLPYVICIALALMASALPRLWLNSFQPYDLFLTVIEVLLAMLAAAVFLQIQKCPFSILYSENQLEGFTSWIVFIGLLLLALIQENTIFTVVANTIARAIVLFAAYWFGPGLAAAAGALLGFILGVQSSGFIWISVLTFSGFLAGLFRSFGRLAVVVSFLLGTASLSLYLFGWQALGGELTASLAVSILLLLLPLLPIKAKALVPFIQGKIKSEAEKVREETAVRLHECSLILRELANAFLTVAADKQEKKDPVVTTLIEGTIMRVCWSCPSRRRCWERDLQRTYNATIRILSELDKGRLISEMRVPDYFEKQCSRKYDYISTMYLLQGLEKNGQAWQRKLADSHELVTIQLMGLAEIMMKLGKEVRENFPGKKQQPYQQCFYVELGIAQVAKERQDVCGDYYSYLELRDGRQVFLLSDGMGNGSRAQQESRTAVKLVEQLLLAGFEQDAVIRTVNTLLQLRSQEESFATLDILMIDTEKGEAEFLKNGAAPSYVKAEQSVREIKSPSLPVGILSEVELKPVTVSLHDDCMIVMVTDGIFEAFPQQPDWLKNYLLEQTYMHPQVLADEILAKARQLYGSSELRDDLTILVCRAKRLKHKIRDYMTA
ncbi:MAG: SpoIIE family protein phosphatase [Firmicutes bacterium]|nr:SpoIIE family protein phosphatase [Bacillota bacterium]